MLASNAGERFEFRYAVHVHWPGVAELGLLHFQMVARSGPPQVESVELGY